MFYLENVPEMSPSYSVVSIVLSIALIVANWKILEKAGEAGWKAIIPIYNIYTLVKVVDGNGWKFLLFLVPFVNIVYLFMFSIKQAKAFGKGTGFGIGLVFLSPIFTLILGFGSAQYVGRQ